MNRTARAIGVLTLGFAITTEVGAAPGAPRVLVAPFSGIISPVAAEFITSAISKAQIDRDAAIVLELDTPGGLDASMRLIVQAELASTVPVIVYVHPAGGRAASAGVFITLAANLAAMAPGTNIGAAHPVRLPSFGSDGRREEKGDDVMEGKLVNDASAYLKSIARERGRNEAWAAEAVTRSVSVPVDEAVREKVVDLQAASLEELLRLADGRKAPGAAAPLRTAGAVVERFELTRRQRWLAALSDPNVAMILMSLGAGGLFVELYSPGLILPGIVGAVSLLLAFYSFQTLSASYAGVLLIAVGLACFLLEVKVVSYGMLGVGGAASVLLGMLLLFQRQGLGGLGVSWGVAAATLGGLLSVTAAASCLVLKSARLKPATGADAMVGARGRAVTSLELAGKVLVGGETWDAVAEGAPIAAGAEVVVTAVRGLRLTVVAGPKAA